VPVEASNEPTAPTPTAKKVIETSTKEMHFSAVDFENLQTENEELKTKVAELEVKLSETQIKPITFNPETQNKTQIDLSKTDSKTRITNELNNLIK
jgi:propanediol utilization protein